MTVPVVLAIAGVVTLFLGVWGGGIKAKEIEIPPAAPKARLIAGIIGLIFIGISIRLSLPTSNDGQQASPATPTTVTVTGTTITATPLLSSTSTTTPFPSPTLTSVPTLTVEEQSTEILKSATQSWKLKILDTFDSNNYSWPVGERPTSDQEDLAKVSINGKYYVDIQTGDGGSWWLLSKIQTPSEFYFTANARRTSVQSGCIMSLTWSTMNGHYLFEIYDKEKNYRLEVYDRNIDENDGWRDVIPKTTTNLILPQEVNRLSVINDGTYIWLYINDHYIDRAENEYVSSGDLGFFVSVCQENSQVTFEFDNLELRSPQE
jgi:hypothetical protein